MKVNINKPKLKKLYLALQDKKPKDEFQLARTNLSSDALERYVLTKLKEADAKKESK
jgi:hypothetical protein